MTTPEEAPRRTLRDVLLTAPTTGAMECTFEGVSWKRDGDGWWCGPLIGTRPWDRWAWVDLNIDPTRLAVPA